MNLETVLLCAQATARQQLTALGYVGDDVQELLDTVQQLLAPEELVEEVAVEAPVAKAKKTKAAAAPAAE